MKLEERIELMVKLGEWLKKTNTEEWKSIRKNAFEQNNWFIEQFVNHRLLQISNLMLDEKKLNQWIRHYHLDNNIESKLVGIVMAGNIPLVGFHDLLCAFMAGHRVWLRPSSKDTVLLKAVVDKLAAWNPEAGHYIELKEMLKGCDAYLATGSNNTSRYFEYYFGKYPALIRRNKTSVAFLQGDETAEELRALADDVCLYFGLGCRNVTQVFVPGEYDFKPLLKSFEKYAFFSDHHRYKNNYDYNLALLIMNKEPYMSNEMMVLVNKDQLFSPVGELFYSPVKDGESVKTSIADNENIQCISGRGYLPFGSAQQTGLFDYADGVDTMEFLLGL